MTAVRKMQLNKRMCKQGGFPLSFKCAAAFNLNGCNEFGESSLKRDYSVNEP